MATIKDVSKATGLSISTISKYLNGGNVLPENRERIRAAVTDLGYSVNHLARSLKINRTMTVGVLIPSLDSPFFSRILLRADDVLSHSGYDIMVCSYNFDHRRELGKLRFLANANVDGILLVQEGLTQEDIAAIPRLADIPVVFLDRTPSFPVDSVVCDNLNAAYAAVERFILNRHTRIGIIAGPDTISTARERRIGYRRVYSDYFLPVDETLIKEGTYQLPSGYSLFGELMDMPNPPTAVFVTNYEMMLGAVTAARDRGIRIPQDVDFIGYDHVELSQLMEPRIPIVVQPMEAMGTAAAQLLLTRMRGDWKGFPATIRLKATIED